MSERKTPKTKRRVTASAKRPGSTGKKWKGSSLKRTYSSHPSASSSSSSRWAPTKRLLGASKAADNLRAQLAEHPMLIPDPDFSGLSLKEEKKAPRPTMLVPVIEQPTRDMVLNPARETARRVARMALTGSNAMKTIYPFRCATSVNMSSSATGSINAAIAVNSITLVPEWADFAAIFDEFFVLNMVSHWSPVARYTGGPWPLLSPAP